MQNTETQILAREYSEKRFGQKIRRHFRKAGSHVVEQALILYFTARAPETPVWCKTTIYGALGYFVSLIDGIPDLTPVLGYSDDLMVLTAAVATLAAHITPEARARARARSESLFGSVNGSPTLPESS